jgi:succinate dehydrogenase / fumarate reductase, flavoprotein subunit
VIREKYGNLFEMYERITAANFYEVPMRIYPAMQYTMGGLWVDYNLMSTIPGLFVIGEANFSDHGANRLGASALMQGLANGYFILSYTLSCYLATSKFDQISRDHPVFQESESQLADRLKKLLSIKGKRTLDSIHQELGKLMWNNCGMVRSERGLQHALEQIPGIHEEFWRNVNLLGGENEINQAHEKAGRVADFLDLAELMCLDAIERAESCGCHFREELQTPDGEAQRDDERFCYVSAWEYAGDQRKPVLNKETLEFDYEAPSQRSYK